jgi:hypothetical protein
VKKIYISGPMTGYPEFNYPAFKAAEIALRAHDYEPLNPACHDISGPAQRWQWYMRKAIIMLMEADAIATLPGWHDSRGAKIEVEIALVLHMPILSIQDWLAA